MNPIPDEIATRMAELHDEKGLQWLEQLPVLLDECARRWSLKTLPPYPLSYNYVAPALRSDDTSVVIKAGAPNPELLSEMAALQLYDGQGIVQLLDVDLELGVML